MKGSALAWLLIISTLLLDIIAFGLALGAESRRSTAVARHDVNSSITYCKYSKDVSTGMGVGAFFLLLFGQLLITGATRCLCGSTSLRQGGARTLAVTLFVLSWFSFIIAEICLIAGASKAAYRTKSTTFFSTHPLTCETLRKGIFSAAAAFSFFTLIFSEGYYVSQLGADDGPWQPQSYAGASVGMTSYPKSREDQARV
ncbi:hypothetical protein O6H91_01G049400 [Diphasiastrum complanatum]|uniref:Uncharacterized protein n=1 Tax=Diphasiastrum complanatum TaxID=34168 RepID=A0ACC2EQT3_DIPCM|nr:hypothetical protein O6H91_01G049400 [Diphasiastrum complanatum]